STCRTEREETPWLRATHAWTVTVHARHRASHRAASSLDRLHLRLHASRTRSWRRSCLCSAGVHASCPTSWTGESTSSARSTDGEGSCRTGITALTLNRPGVHVKPCYARCAQRAACARYRTARQRHG